MTNTISPGMMPVVVTTAPNTQPALQNTRDAMCNQIINHVRLNRYDLKFMINITRKYVEKGQALTQKQSDVWDVIVHKYRKQLKKLDINYKDALALKWKNGIYSEQDLQMQSFFKIENNTMYMYFKFDKNIIDEIRALTYDDDGEFLNKDNTEDTTVRSNIRYDFVWDKNKRLWHGEFNVHLFRSLYNFAVNHDINIYKSVTDILSEIHKTIGGREYWETKLHISGDQMYINNIEETMLPSIADFDFSDTSHVNIEQICMTLCIKPPDGNNKYRNELITITPNSSRTYDATSPVAQDELYKYLKDTDKTVLFYLPRKGPFSFGRNTNKFIINEEMASWNIKKMIIRQGDIENQMKHAHLLEFDTVVSKLSMSEMIQSISTIKALPLDISKYIRIK